MTYARGDRNSESGSVLLLSLAFIIVIMVLAVGLLGITRTGNASLRAYELERTRRYSVNSALETSVQMVKQRPDLGVTATPLPCGLEYEVTGEQRVIGPDGNGSAYLYVVCSATDVDGAVSGGPDSDGGQAPRDVTFEVRCATDPVSNPPQAGFIVCGSGGDYAVLGTARVRYEVDIKGIEPPAGSTASPERAVVPKVISWEVRR